MALPDNPYIVTSDVDTFFVNKDTGLPLANGLLYFYKDSARTVKKNVYQISGNYPSYTFDTPFPNPIVLSAVGTVQNASGDNLVIYYKPYDDDGNIEKYYVVCTDQNGVEQFTRTDWPNIEASSSPLPPDQEDNNLSNQISNPTFSNILINDGLVTTYSVTAATDQEFLCAPNWTFVISGTGTVKVQRTAIAGSDNIETNPPYVLDVEVSSGITSCKLRQRFEKNSGLWSKTDAADVFLNGSFLAKSLTGSTTNLKLYYSESTGNSNIVIVNGTVTTAYSVLKGTSAIPKSLNTDVNGYTDIFFSFSESSHVVLSSIQLIPTNTNVVTDFPQDFDSSNRNESYQGDYYIPRLSARTGASLLTGWDFTMSPWQFGSTPQSLATSSKYVVDQTICAMSAGSTIDVTQVGATTRGLQFKTLSATGACYMLQYLEVSEAKKILRNRLSVNVFGSINADTGSVTTRVYMYRTDSTGSFPISSTGESIGDVDTLGNFILDPTRGLNWTEIPRNGLGQAQANMAQGFNDYGFSGWNVPDSQISGTNKFAIVVTFYFTGALVTGGITIQSVSCVPGDIPCRPNFKTFSETLRECQYYYEKSYSPTVAVGTPNYFFNMILCTQAVSPLDNSGGVIARNVFPSSWQFSFLTTKRVSPRMTFYAPTTGTASNMEAVIQNNGVPQNLTPFDPTPVYFSTLNYIGVNGIFSVAANPFTLTTTNANNSGLYGYIRFHYQADARIGIVT